MPAYGSEFSSGSGKMMLAKTMLKVVKTTAPTIWMATKNGLCQQEFLTHYQQRQFRLLQFIH
jgi:hypothetical protein